MPYKYSMKLEDLLLALVETFSGQKATQMGIDDDGFYFVVLPNQLTAAQMSKLKGVLPNIKEEEVR